MTRRLLTGYLTITVLVLVILGVPLAVLHARYERSRLVESVTLDAAEAAAFAVLPLALGDHAQLHPVVRDYGAATPGRMVIVNRDGVSVADSHDRAGRSFASRPEFRQALQGRPSSGYRASASLGRDLFFVVAPVNSGAVVLGAVRITYPATYVEERILRSRVVLGAVAVLVLAGVVVISVAMARTVARPLRALERAAKRLGEGDLDARAATMEGPPEVRSLARSFDETAAKLQRLVDAQRAFVADASHQLRTPLAAMRLRLDNLSASAGDSAKGDLAAAVAEVHRLRRIVDGLLVLGRAEVEESRARDVDVDAVAAERVEMWAPYAAERGVTLSAEGHAGAARITPDTLDQTLDNLLANAIEATPEGGAVRVLLARDERFVHVHVVDQGSGMAEGERELAFARHRSSRADPTDVGGFGLGLSIAQRLTMRDGGDLTLDTASPGGVDAHLRLPRPSR